ncbi:MAG: DNA polymerase III subunit chi [Pseudorhodobacter sp.]|nr:DNA polymerase III subunit chi [Rhizobacter sp.]
MTEITFYFNVPDRLNYACRLLRKALKSGSSTAGAGVAVLAPGEMLIRLDRALWTFDATEFIPHVLLSTAAPAQASHLRTPVWLVEQAERAAHLNVLLHLGDDPALGFESFERLIEIVPSDPQEREAARARWKHYKARGYEIQKHDVAP